MSINSDLQWYLDNGGRKALEARGGYRPAIHPHACPGDGASTVSVADPSSRPIASLRARGSADTIRGKDVSLDVPGRSGPLKASQRDFRKNGVGA